MKVSRTRSMSAVGKTESRSGSRRLGPAVYMDINVNGVPTKALVDTGSPATIIIALDCVMDHTSDPCSMGRRDAAEILATRSSPGPVEGELMTLANTGLDMTENGSTTTHGCSTCRVRGCIVSIVVNLTPEIAKTSLEACTTLRRDVLARHEASTIGW